MLSKIDEQEDVGAMTDAACDGPPLMQQASETAYLTLGELRQLAARGDIEGVAVIAPDHLGRSTGKRYTAAAFLEEVVNNGALMCSYVLDRDVDNSPLPGSWAAGLDDFVMVPDLSTLRQAAWLEKTAVVICDLVGQKDHQRLAHSPREILRRQLARLQDRGLRAGAASELEFILFRNTYREAFDAGYRNLDQATYFNGDFSALSVAAVDDFLTPLRRVIIGSGLQMVDWKTESNLGQVEINFQYSDALSMADDHLIYKDLTKGLAMQMGYAATFMPKYDDREGNSCHIHMSLWDEEGSVFSNPDGTRTKTFEAFLAGLLKYTREMTYWFALNVNSYKRLQPNAFAPTSLVWGEDNRTTCFRVVGRGPSLRVETRLAGGDCNPYLAFAALIAMGLAGIDEGLTLEPPLTGNAYARDDLPTAPANLRAAVELLAGSNFARKTFGDEVVEHYATLGRFEADEFDKAVTDWELRRSFERL